MKILHISTFPTGGAGVFARQLHQSCINGGLNSKILFLDNQNVELNESYSFLKQAGSFGTFKRTVQKIKIKLNKGSVPLHLQPFNSPFSPFDITKSPLYKWADIIHFHWTTHFLDYPSFFKKNIKPIVWTCHDMFPFSHGSHFSLEKPPGGNYQKIKFDAMDEQNIHFTFPSFWLQNQFSGSHPKARNFKAYQIHNSYKSGFQGLAMERNNEEVIFLFVSWFLDDPRKRLKTLLPIFEKLNGRANLWIVGKGHLDNLPENVVQLGLIQDDQKMQELYSQADYLLSISTAENMPLNILEALACGTPVLACDVGGISEVLVDAQNGFLIPSSSEAIENKIMDCLQNPIDWNYKKIAESTKANHHPDAVASAFKELYSSLG